MKTKEEYEKALKEINDAFYGDNFLNNQTRRFDDNLNLLRELVNDHFEENQETNFDHYKDRILDCCIDNLAVVKGIPKSCSKIDCNDCDFLTIKKECCEIAKDWLKQPCKKPTYKLSQFEYDLIKTFDSCKECCLFNEIECLKKLTQKGYFNGIDPFTKVHEILDNCEVI